MDLLIPVGGCMAPHVCFWTLRAQDVLPRSCLLTPSLYLAQNPPVNLVGATTPLTGVLPAHFMTLAIQTSPPLARATSPFACFPDKGQIEEESLGNKVL